MTATASTVRSQGLLQPILATRIIFLLAGSCVSAWAPLVPFAKARLELSDGRLGLLLLCGGGGAVLAMPLAGALAGRFGCRLVIGVAATFAIIVLPCLAGAGAGWQLAAALLCFGATNGSVDATMNIQAVFVERAAGRPLMNGFHGLWSVGSILGAGLVSLLIWQGAPPLVAASSVAALLLAVLAATVRSLPAHAGDRAGPSFAVPHGRVIVYGLLCLILFLAEGSVLDWSAVFLSNVRHVAPARSAIGYVVCATAMTVCRLTGDPIVRNVGAQRVVIFGSLTAAFGFLIVMFVPIAIVDVVGFGLVGVGLANSVPVIFSATGRQTSMPTNLAIPAMTTLAYAGTLAGPAVIGRFANHFGLSAAFGLIVFLLSIVAGSASRARLE